MKFINGLLIASVAGMLTFSFMLEKKEQIKEIKAKIHNKD